MRAWNAASLAWPGFTGQQCVDCKHTRLDANRGRDLLPYGRRVLFLARFTESVSVGVSRSAVSQGVRQPTRLRVTLVAPAIAAQAIWSELTIHQS
jgi:hypothetical protein